MYSYLAQYAGTNATIILETVPTGGGLDQVKGILDEVLPDTVLVRSKTKDGHVIQAISLAHIVFAVVKPAT